MSVRCVKAYFEGVCAAAILSSLTVSAAPAPAIPAPNPATAGAESDSGDLLQFLDGGILHGELQSMDIERGVRWRHPAARGVIEFSPENLSVIRFDDVQPVLPESPATCRFQFSNGDEVYGNLSSMNADTIAMDAPFGGSLEAPRRALQSMAFFQNGFKVLYEGPNGVDGWRLERGPRGWQYRDGAFVTSTVGTLGRDLKLNGPCNFEFDLAWSGHFSLSFILYAQSIDRFDYSQNSYMFHVAPSYLNVQRVQAGVGVTSIGQAHMPELFRNGKIRLQIRANKEDSTIGIWANGKLVQKWKDHAGLNTRGSGVVFSSQMDGPEIKLSNIRVTEWDSALEPDPPSESELQQDVIHLRNRDKVIGDVVEIRDGKLVASVEQTNLEIPLGRVTQVYLAQKESGPVASKPWQIRVDVAGGGRVSFELEKWTDERISGRSTNFGLVALNPESIRQIQFNPGRSATAAQEAKNDTWDFDE